MNRSQPGVYGDDPINMNTGDKRGDMYFNFKSSMIPLECQNNETHGLDCRNRETMDPNLVVSKLVLEVDGRYGSYQMCNVCVDGKDPLGGMGRRRLQWGWGGNSYNRSSGGRHPHTSKNCSMTGGDGVPGSSVPEYICDCGGRGGGTCDETQIGRESIGGSYNSGRNYSSGSQHNGSSSHGGGGRHRRPPPPPPTPPSAKCTAAATKVCGADKNDPRKCYGCFNDKVDDLQKGGCKDSELRGAMMALCFANGWGGRGGGGNHTRGNYSRHRSPTSQWDSDLKSKLGGYWYSTRAAGRCTDATDYCGWRVVKAVKRVSKQCADDSMYRYIEERDSNGCFANCSTPTDGSPRNKTDICWVKCLFAVVLGSEAAEGKEFNRSSGLTLRQLDEAWERPFKSNDYSKGGCPDYGGHNPGWVAPEAEPEPAAPGTEPSAEPATEVPSVPEPVPEPVPVVTPEPTPVPPPPTLHPSPEPAGNTCASGTFYCAATGFCVPTGSSPVRHECDATPAPAPTDEVEPPEPATPVDPGNREPTGNSTSPEPSPPSHGLHPQVQVKTTNAKTDAPGHSDTSVATIVGGCVGVALALIVMMVLCTKRQTTKKSSGEMSTKLLVDTDKYLDEDLDGDAGGF